MLSALALVLRLHNLSPYKVYPDSYQSLLVASNLMHAHRLTARLGTGGMLYPPLFAWTRPLYPLLIALTATLLGASLAAAGQIVAVIASLLSIIAAYLLVKVMLRSQVAGFIAAILLAISYNATVWSGFILTEPLAILTLALALWQLWRRRARPDAWGTGGDLATGLLLALAILARYENAIVLLPAMLWVAPRLAPKRAVTVAATALIITGLTLLILHPFAAGSGQLWPQLVHYLPIVCAGLSLLLAGIAAQLAGLAGLPRWRWYLGTGAATLLVVGALALAINHQLYLGLWEFSAHDPLLTILALIGLTAMLVQRRTQAAGAFILTTATLLGAIYYASNPTMDRYLAHLLPLLAVPAAYAVLRIIVLPYRFTATGLVIAGAIAQIVITWTGLHHTDGGVWFQAGYEQTAANQVAPLVTSQDLILSATPEPYRLETTAAVQGIPAAGAGPLTIAPPAGRTVILVDDASLRQTNPGFATAISQRLRPYLIQTFPNTTPYRYVTSIELGNKPVMVYKLALTQLQCEVNRVGSSADTCPSS
jgi:4-amino-4-deoxy-L-arabinose transferase-like glycosyltransferase